jgi:hypothetical protein
VIEFQTAPRITYLFNAVVIEYQSVYDVHPPPDPDYPNMRIQPADFDRKRILSDLERVIDPSNYDLVPLYSLVEVPGWIRSGLGPIKCPAKNIGVTNQCFGRDIAPPNWPKLRSVPHMNSIDFSDSEDGVSSFGGTVVLFHEFAHQWLPKLSD